MTLDVYRSALGDRARSWLALHADERRRRAVEAAAQKDADGLWSLTEAYLGLYGASGILVSPHTLSAYRTGVTQFVQYAQEHALNVLRPSLDDAQAYVLALLERRKIATVRGKVAAAASLYKALRWAGASDVTPFAGVRVPKDHEHPLTKNPPYSPAVLRRVFGKVDEALLASTGRERLKVQGARTLLLLLSHTGLRIQEALDLAWSDVFLDEDEPYITVRSGKGRKSRTVGLSDRLAVALRSYRALPRRRSHAAAMVLPFRTRAAAANLLRPYFERDGVDEHGRPVTDWRGCHAFRKATGTRLYEALGDFVAVAEVLGHADINVTRSYVRVGSGRANKAMRDW
ncbi:integrase/recombinase XerC [Deinococcus metalli]|uniref:Integrase n=1 Tax=Deinococcus metalli TaxID=1141878 RepID=A0A7W8KE42_9DEIO|nr:site-specific integrase [Deinococcus metalli]MBB5376509.1 integrase/recombinase XerC [Deinococcus metalli]GHF43498.1 integrase [Deinococcus metalli]